MKKYKNSAFTLVELIVVITILAILGTIAFISLEGYSAQSRDSTRISDLSTMKTSLELFQLDAGKYPLPTDGLDITYSGGVVWNQGIFGESVHKNVEKLDKIPTDPLTNSKYTYSVTATRNEYEIAGIIETDLALNILNNSFAGDVEAIAIVSGTYNGQMTKALSGTTCDVLSIPTIIASDIETSRDIVEITNNERLVYDGYNNLPNSYKSSKFNVDGGFKFNPNNLVAYSDSSSCSPLSDSEDNISRSRLIKNLQRSYSGTILKNESKIKRILSLDITNQRDVNLLGISLVNNSLGKKISITDDVLKIPACVDAQTPTEEIYFTFDETTNTITDYNPTGGTDVVIPCTINGKRVTNIGKRAFDNNNLTSLVIPQSIFTIGERAFDRNVLTSVINYDGHNSTDYIYIPSLGEGIEINGYIGLSTNLTIPGIISGKTVTSIGEGAFMRKNLVSVIIPESVINIGKRAFYDNSLASLVFPQSIVSIGSHAFWNNSFTNVIIPSNVTTILGGNALGNTLTSVTNYDGNISTDYVYIPILGGIEIVDYIGTATNVIIPNIINGKTVTSIGNTSFYNLSLTSVIIPSSVTNIGKQAFNRNPLTSVTNYDGNISTEYIYIPNGSDIEIVDYIGTSSSVTIPSSINGKTVTSIGDTAFYFSSSITSVVIPNSVISIGSSAFGACSLISVTIPSSVTYIGNSAFYYQNSSVGNGTVYGPASGYVFDTYANSDASVFIGEFDKTKLPNYVVQ